MTPSTIRLIVDAAGGPKAFAAAIRVKLRHVYYLLAGKRNLSPRTWQWSSNPGPPGQAIRAHLGHLRIANDSPGGQSLLIVSSEPVARPGSLRLPPFLGLHRLAEPIALAVH